MLVAVEVPEYNGLYVVSQSWIMELGQVKWSNVKDGKARGPIGER